MITTKQIVDYFRKRQRDFWTFPRAVEALGFVDLHLHDLRHEAISRLFAAGFRITDVQPISGHRDLKMLSRYTHITASDVHAQAHRLKAA